MMINELKKLQAEITQGDWTTSRDAVPEGHIQTTVYEESDGQRVATVFINNANAAAIALVPQLIAQNIELIEENERLKEVLLELLKETNEHAAGFCPKLMEACKNAKAALGVKE